GTGRSFCALSRTFVESARRRLSAIDQTHARFRVAGTGDHTGSECGLELPEIFVRQRDFGSRDVLFQMVGLGSTGNGHDIGAEMEQPSKRDLAGFSVLGLRD